VFGKAVKREELLPAMEEDGCDDSAIASTSRSYKRRKRGGGRGESGKL
jgi:hypothetical protein